jgi:hypothetical protein
MSKFSRTDGREEAPRKRVPFGGRRAKLQLSAEDDKGLKSSGWTARWVNDKDGRIQQAQAGGYVFCTPEEAPSIGQFSVEKGDSDLNGKVSLIVSKGDSNPIRAYLMKIQTKYYKEDQITKEQANIDYDDALRAGQPGGNVVDNQYVPEGHTQKI